MMNSITLKRVFLVGVNALLIQTCSAQVVVAGAKSTIPTLTKDQVASLYVGSSFVLPNGASVGLLDQPDGADVRKQFYSKITDKSASQIKSTWSRLTFSGKGTPPKEVSNSADVKKQVSSNLSDIGYIEKSAVDGSVKVLYTIE
ncbi:phosphate ABC transporter substrate-binding protein [Sapientia aquatica]|uniref:Phosphate ABC transporter substrate-binding protein n=1 Tax=Sapientia aquatica TaxID=1549640 RepID=A0A4R5W5S6_9BURK|nr:phosphate ABC transporter substrate-binding protein [Sapientia aquatica]TDK67287.1 phosphate ABC transporter substrate-binding protein [Sapientia aquatica]